MMEKIIGKKQKWTNKETGKPYVADSLIHTYNLSYLMFVPNFKILGQAVPKKSLTKKSYQIDRQTSLQKRQKLYTPYILRIPGV